MRSYRKRQMVKIYKKTRRKCIRLFSLACRDKSYAGKYTTVERVHGRAFGSILYYLHKIRKVIEI